MHLSELVIHGTADDLTKLATFIKQCADSMTDDADPNQTPPKDARMALGKDVELIIYSQK